MEKPQNNKQETILNKHQHQKKKKIQNKPTKNQKVW